MKEFLWGTLAMSIAVAILLLFRYGKVARDRLFLYFSAAFLAMTFNWLGLAIIEPDNEHRHVAYMLRLLAFVLILVGTLAGIWIGAYRAGVLSLTDAVVVSVMAATAIVLGFIWLVRVKMTSLPPTGDQSAGDQP